MHGDVVGHRADRLENYVAQLVLHERPENVVVVIEGHVGIEVVDGLDVRRGLLQNQIEIIFQRVYIKTKKVLYKNYKATKPLILLPERIL